MTKSLALITHKIPACLSTLALMLAGIIGGCAHLLPTLWPLAWLEFFLTAMILSVSSHRGWQATGLLLAGIAGQMIGHTWYLSSLANWVIGGGWDFLSKTLPVWFCFLLLIVLPERLPMFLGALFIPRQVPLWVWWPLTWWLGEQACINFTGLSQGAWLYSQWQVVPVLRTVGHLGWTPTLIVCMLIAVMAGQSVSQRSFVLAGSSVFLALILLFMPALPDTIPPILNKVGVVHMETYFYPPLKAPPGIELLIWPEVARSGRPPIGEGPHPELILESPFRSTNTYHLIGQETRAEPGPNGLQNSLLALAPNGQVLGMRAKKLLFPAGETPFWGWRLPSRNSYIPGKAPITLTINHHKIAALVCYESLFRSLVDTAVTEKAELLTISAIDISIGSSFDAETQFTAIAVLRAVETGLSVVRASLHGPANLIAPDGRLLAHSHSGTNGILTLQKDWPSRP